MIGILLAANIMYCDIKGEVKKPGVYQIKDNNIDDVINLAGGLTKNANVQYINLSKTVLNEIVIYIPHQKEKKISCPVCKCPKLDCLDNERIVSTTKSVTTTKLIPTTSKYITSSVTTTSVINTKVNINNASIEELKTLNGIGEVIATKIVEYRNNTLFNKIEDIMNVQGVGPSIFAKIKDFITV